MDDLTTIKGIGKATAKKLAAAGYDSYAALAGATGAADLAKLQDAGFATVEIDAWVKAAAELVAVAQNSEGGNADGANPSPPDTGDAGGSSSGEGEAPTSTDAPAAGETPQGTFSADNPPSEAAGGGSNPAAPAELPGHDGWLAFLDLGRDEAERRFPLTLAALQAWAEGAGSAVALQAGPTIRIAAKRDGFRRAGVAHSREPVDHPAERWTPDELEALLAEPNLRVELV